LGVLIKQGDAQVYQPPGALGGPRRRGLQSVVEEGNGAGKVGPFTGRLVSAAQQVTQHHAGAHLFGAPAGLLAAADRPREIIRIAAVQVTVLQPKRQVRQRGRRDRRMRGGDLGRPLQRADGTLQRREVSALSVHLADRQAEVAQPAHDQTRMPRRQCHGGAQRLKCAGEVLTAADSPVAAQQDASPVVQQRGPQARIGRS
jgi:hypothetical protein